MEKLLILKPILKVELLTVKHPLVNYYLAPYIVCFADNVFVPSECRESVFGVCYELSNFYLVSVFWYS